MGSWAGGLCREPRQPATSEWLDARSATALAVTKYALELEAHMTLEDALEHEAPEDLFDRLPVRIV